MALRFKITYIVLMLLSQFGEAMASDIPKIEKGVLDLRKIESFSQKEIELKGEWFFYWNTFLLYDEIKQSEPSCFIEVPSFWNTASINDSTFPKHGGATYRLQILLPKGKVPLSIKLGSIGTAFCLYVDSKIVTSAGTVSLDKEKALPGYNPGVYDFIPEKDTCELLFHVSNYHYTKAGLWGSFCKIGTPETMEKSWNKDVYISLLLVGSILLFALYHLGLFLLNVNFRYTLYFSLFCLIIVIRTLVVNEILMLYIFPGFNWSVLVKLEYLTLLLGTWTFSVYIYKFFHALYSKTVLKVVVATCCIMSFFVLFFPANVFTAYLQVFQLVIFMASLYIISVVIRALKSDKVSSIIILSGFIILLLAVINDILFSNKLINTLFLTSYGFLVFVFSQAIMLAARFSSLFSETESLAFRLEETNQNLEELVQQRTHKIQEQNNLLTEQNDEISAQRDNIEQQHEILQKQKKQITSSIQYASRIQNAVIEASDELENMVKEYFILFHPKDIVSGDFYWFKQIEINKKKYEIITVVDCTGHGVPGAFMSILGALIIKYVVNTLEKPNAGEILDYLRKEVKEILKQNAKHRKVSDGMDMSLVILDKEEGQMYFAGANNPIYIMRKGQQGYSNELEEIKGDNNPIGFYAKEKPSFTNHTIAINSDDVVYMFTDGYFDQFNGQTKEKFKKKRFKQLLLDNKELSLSQQKLKLETTLFHWMGDFEQIDDITVVGFKV
jgi:serine phosphatase RsbU (regulator of sigma subunit)